MENHFKSQNFLHTKDDLNVKHFKSRCSIFIKIIFVQGQILHNCQNTIHGESAQFNRPSRQLFNRLGSSQSFAKQNQEHSYYQINENEKYQDIKRSYYLNDIFINQQNDEEEAFFINNSFYQQQQNVEKDYSNSSQLKQFDNFSYFEQRHLQQQNLEEQKISLQNYMQDHARQISNQISQKNFFALQGDENQQQNQCNERIGQEQIEKMQNQQETRSEIFKHNQKGCLTNFLNNKQELHNNQNYTQSDQKYQQLSYEKTEMKNQSFQHCQNTFYQNNNQNISDLKNSNNLLIYKKQSSCYQNNPINNQNEINQQNDSDAQKADKQDLIYLNNKTQNNEQQKYFYLSHLNYKQDDCFKGQSNSCEITCDEPTQNRDCQNNNQYFKSVGQQSASSNMSQKQNEQCFELEKNLQKQIDFKNPQNQLQNQNCSNNYDGQQQYQQTFDCHIKNEYFQNDQSIQHSNTYKNQFAYQNNYFQQQNNGQDNQIQIQNQHKNNQNEIQQKNNGQSDKKYLSNHSEQQEGFKNNQIYTQQEKNQNNQLLTQDYSNGNKQIDINDYPGQWQYDQNNQINKQNENTFQNVSQSLNYQTKQSYSSSQSYYQWQNYENNQSNKCENKHYNASQSQGNQIKQSYSNNQTEQWQNYEINQINQQNEFTENKQNTEQLINCENRQIFSNNIQFACKKIFDQEAIQVNNFQENQIIDHEQIYINKLTPLNFNNINNASFIVEEEEILCKFQEKSFSQLNSQYSSQILEQEVRESSKFQIQAKQNSFYGLDLKDKEYCPELDQIDNGFEFLYYADQSKEQWIQNQSKNCYQQQNLGVLSCDLTNIQKKNVVKNIMTSFKNFITLLFQKEILPLRKVKKDHQFQKSSISIFFQEQQQEDLYSIRKEVLKIHLKNESQEQIDNEQSFLKKFKRANKDFYQLNLSSIMDNQICDDDQNFFNDFNYLRDVTYFFIRQNQFFTLLYWAYTYLFIDCQCFYNYFQNTNENLLKRNKFNFLHPANSINNHLICILNIVLTMLNSSFKLLNTPSNMNDNYFLYMIINRQHSSFSLTNNNYNNRDNNHSAKNCNNNKINIFNNNLNGNQQTNSKTIQVGIQKEYRSPNSKNLFLIDQDEDYLTMNDVNYVCLGFSSGIQQTMLRNVGSNQIDMSQNCMFENRQEQYKEITQIQGRLQNQIAKAKIENKSKIKGELIDSWQKSNEIKIKRMEKKKQKQLAFQQKISSYPKRVLRSQRGQNTPVKMQGSSSKTHLSIDDRYQSEKNRYFHENNQPSITQFQETHQQIKENLNQEVSQQNSYLNGQQKFVYLNQTQIEEDIPQNLVTANCFGTQQNKNSCYYHTQNIQQPQIDQNYQNQSIFIQNQLKMGENSFSDENQLIQPMQNNQDINYHQNSLRSSQAISQNEYDLQQDRNDKKYLEVEDNKEYSQIYTSNQREYAENDGASILSIIPDLKGLLSSINTIQKKNVVKNLMRSFKRFVVSLFEKEQQDSKKTKKDYLFKKYSINIYFDQNQQQTPEVLSQIRSQILSFYYDYQKQENQVDEQKFLKKYKRYLDNKLFNHYTLSLLLKHQQYALIFKYYLENFFSNWLINSKVNDRISHQLMVEFLLKYYTTPQLVQQLEHNQYQKKEAGL
ncbi:hypothetical protein ABPG72_002503 [Tetrahymena utriculariae]